MIPNPYTALAGVLVAAALLGGVWLHGRASGKARQLEADTARIAQAEGHRAALARALSANARTFRAIAGIAQANQRLAEKRREAALQANREATADAAALRDRIATINRQAERERATCPEGRMPICGSPLH